MHNEPRFFPALQGVRGILSLWVFSLHVMLFIAFGLKIIPEQLIGTVLTRIFWSGYLAVDFFFLLSGFFVSHVYLSKNAVFNRSFAKRFLWNRLVRLYPVHALMLAVYVVIIWGIQLPLSDKCFPYDPTQPCTLFGRGQLFENLLLVQSWGWFPMNSWNVNAWSISTEWAVYLCAPLLISLFRRQHVTWIYWLFAFMMMTALVSILHSSHEAIRLHGLLLGTLEKTSNHTAHELFQMAGPGALEFGLLRGFCGFLSGCLVYRLKDSLPLFLTKPAIPLILLIMLLLTIQFLPVWICYFIFIPLLVTLTYDNSLLSHVLSTRVMNWLGNISYSLYMVHGLIIKLSMTYVPILLQSNGLITSTALVPATIGVIVAVTLAFSHLCYCYFESPIRNRLQIRR